MTVINVILTPWAPIIVVLLYYVVPYFTTYGALRSIPAPLGAAFTNIWLLFHCRRGQRYIVVDNAHKKLGKVVRIQPNHVSIADPEAIQVIYGHGNGFLKSSYYDPFVSIHRGLFSTRDRAEHSRKRKIVSHTFSVKNVSQFEPHIGQILSIFLTEWDRLSNLVPHGSYAKLDALHWFNYLAFDIIGDLAFGKPFGMLEKGRDVAEIRLSPNSPITYASAVEVLNRRGEVNATLGCLPALKPWAKWLPDPFFNKGLAAVENLAGIAFASVGARLDASKAVNGPPHRADLLARLMEGKDEQGNMMGRDELTAEALTQLIAGSDTTSNTSCALLYWVLSTPHVLPKLQAELDGAIPVGVPVPSFAVVKDLRYLQAIISETLRLHSPSSLGLPRLVPPDSPGVSILGRHFPGGTVLSVPSYTIHHSFNIWGTDADQFVPERWEGGISETQKNAFIPFSYGPRSCIGRNVAEVELALITATVFRRYEFELYQRELPTREGFLRKPLECKIGVRRRSNV